MEFVYFYVMDVFMTYECVYVHNNKNTNTITTIYENKNKEIK